MTVIHWDWWTLLYISVTLKTRIQSSKEKWKLSYYIVPANLFALVPASDLSSSVTSCRVSWTTESCNVDIGMFQSSSCMHPCVHASGIVITISWKIRLILSPNLQHWCHLGRRWILQFWGHRPLSHSHFLPMPANSVLSHRQPTHIG